MLSRMEREPGNPALISELNSSFEHGKTIVQETERLQQLRKPILVDFNHVLFNNRDPVVPNPDAHDPLRALQKIGTVVVLTSSNGWKYIQTLLMEHRFWSSDMVLITAANYSHVMQADAYEPGLQKLRSKYESLAQVHNLFDHPQMTGINVTSDEMWSGPFGGKKVAFAFMKPYLIPLIDDYDKATKGNPGILGIQVSPWYSPEERVGTRAIPPENPRWLSDAVQDVSTHYST